jgi:hypothetical protein
VRASGLLGIRRLLVLLVPRQLALRAFLLLETLPFALDLLSLSLRYRWSWSSQYALLPN